MLFILYNNYLFLDSLLTILLHLGSTLLKRNNAGGYGGLFQLLKKVYPDYPWNQQQFQLVQRNNTKNYQRGGQWILYRAIQQLFSNQQSKQEHPQQEHLQQESQLSNADESNPNPNSNNDSTTLPPIFLNYHHPQLLFQTNNNNNNNNSHNSNDNSSNKKMELDVYLPTLSLAFEYQGQQHYEDNPLFGHSNSFQQNDQQKREACRRANITLIEIPYWWNYTVEDLACTIYQYRPDVLVEKPNRGQVIPQEKPKYSKRKKSKAH